VDESLELVQSRHPPILTDVYSQTSQSEQSATLQRVESTFEVKVKDEAGRGGGRGAEGVAHPKEVAESQVSAEQRGANLEQPNMPNKVPRWWEHGTFSYSVSWLRKTQCTITLIELDGMPLVTACNVLGPVSAPAGTSNLVYCRLVLCTA
jgi:hypothetical protein